MFLCFPHTPDTGPTAYKIENVPYYEWNDIDKIIEKVSRKLSLLTGQEVILNAIPKKIHLVSLLIYPMVGFIFHGVMVRLLLWNLILRELFYVMKDGTEYRDRDGQLVFTEVDISPKRDKALDYSIGDMLGFHPISANTILVGKN